MARVRMMQLDKSRSLKSREPELLSERTRFEFHRRSVSTRFSGEGRAYFEGDKLIVPVRHMVSFKRSSSRYKAKSRFKPQTGHTLEESCPERCGRVQQKLNGRQI